MKRLAFSERGAAVVEMAMVSLLLITLLIAVLEGGRLFFMHANLASAARDAAREMAISGDATLAQSRADEVYMFGTPTWGPGVVACPASPGEGDNATVVLTHGTSMLSGIWDNVFTLRGTGVMRCNG